MSRLHERILILLADDDADDRIFITRAFERSLLVNPLRTVNDGEELLDYLYQRGPFSKPMSAPRPGLILLDLNMPRLDGYGALQAIKGDPELRSIPIVVLTTSGEEQDVVRSYDLGVNAFVTKPVTIREMIKALDRMGDFWLKIATLPDHVSR